MKQKTIKVLVTTATAIAALGIAAFSAQAAKQQGVKTYQIFSRNTHTIFETSTTTPCPGVTVPTVIHEDQQFPGNSAAYPVSIVNGALDKKACEVTYSADNGIGTCILKFSNKYGEMFVETFGKKLGDPSEFSTKTCAARYNGDIYMLAATS